MMKDIILVFLSAIFVAISFSFDINSCSNDDIIQNMGKLLIGIPSYKFPKELFLNYAIYGHYENPFSLQDIYNNFGIDYYYPFIGSIVVGSDFKLSGIITETDKVAIPIPGSVITEVPLSSLKKFFPKGYKFRSTMGGFYIWELGGRENATFNGTVQCTDCMNIFGFSKDDLNYTQDNRFWIKWIRLDNLIEIYSYGYLKDYN